MTEGDTRRLRVLIGAYACGPGEGSEPGAGWAFVRAAAEHSDVWVVTRRRFEPAIRAALDDEPDLAAHVHVRYLDLSDRVLRAKRRHRDVYWYYVLWQRALAGLAAELHATVSFDVAHHVTFASDWQPCGLTTLSDVPLVWGPVGGATYQPTRLLRWLGWRGVLAETARSCFTRVARRVWGDPIARRAAVVVALNTDVARRFAYARRVVVEPNIALYDDFPQRTATPRDDGSRRQAVFVGRLLPWKGPQLAIRALARPGGERWDLALYGEGPYEPALRALVGELGLGSRVSFEGHAPRSDVLAALAAADALLFPSMHDSAGWVVGEASAVGCPVVCLDVGGPPLLADRNGLVCPIDGDVVGGLAHALDASTTFESGPTDRWSAERLPAMTARWYADACGRSARASTST
ncbi:Glycosyltransferase involved in cell wall bisynthesis [Jatrophihabitans endophyticus]|uniref:Glycosyltransferase involved in cell wall bisynthesis n=1 Tax=Jatrophihabitans endophyticus TaxID=1206085 RepID=A0A1M5U8D1_9ACTN|nr:glycosyltransferase [Jatrophihabitans endophyticus]SHH59180.1 Glycosyltransferase involved in cell wall bisynthesis [Jatrophihabitans endophyticus]